MLPLPHRRFLIVLSALLGLEFIALAIAPYDRKDWLLENVLVVVFVVAMLATYRKLMLSRLSYFLIFAFLSLHMVGAHYTYAMVPYDAWFQRFTGHSLNSLFGWQRNNFDRLVHFCYGFLLAYPVREVFQRVIRLRGFWGYFFPLDVTMSTSMLYELIEWGAAVMFGGDLGQAYLGTQGDIWDAHKDMAFASLGALIAMLITAGINWRSKRDFADEWNERVRMLRTQNPAGMVR
jgi:putative membrane protein